MIRSTTSRVGHMIFQRTDEGRLVEVAVRRMYDDRDIQPFRGRLFEELNDAHDALIRDEDVEDGTYLILPAMEVHVKLEEPEPLEAKKRRLAAWYRSQQEARASCPRCLGNKLRNEMCWLCEDTGEVTPEQAAEYTDIDEDDS
jgi:hypothetical protein